MKINQENIMLTQLPPPPSLLPETMPQLPLGCYAQRLARIREKMAENGLDSLAIYADREHYSNFKYFAGFEPRFEEGLLVIRPTDPTYFILGNECLHMARFAPISAVPLLYQGFSLPDQPMDHYVPLASLLAEAGVKAGSRVGIAGWKLFTAAHGPDFARMSDLPAFVLEPLRELAGPDRLVNAAHWLIDPAQGIRVTNGADEIAVLEYGAAWASQAVYDALSFAAPGKTEQEVAARLSARGLVQTCHPTLAAGSHVAQYFVSPTTDILRLGDPLAVSIGLEGGLTCRQGYLAAKTEQLPLPLQGYVEELAKPYFAAVASWYATIGVGVRGGDIYSLIDSVLPKRQFGWKLNPGHLTATEEWLSSPIKAESPIELASGMVFQMDIIPSLPPYAGVNAEDGVCLADAALRQEIAARYPDVWRRMQERRRFMQDELGIELKPEVLPMSNLTGYYSPLMLLPNQVFKVAG